MPWKLYIDSRKRVPGARGDTDSDFAFQLPYPITVSGKAYIDVCLLANSFLTIRQGENDRLYLDELAANTKRIAVLAPGQYNVLELRDAMVAALNSNKLIAGQYRVTYLQIANRLQVDIVNPGGADSFRIYPERYLRSNWSAWTGVTGSDDLRSANSCCGFLGGQALLQGTSAIAVAAPNAPDVQPYKQLFMRSNLGGGSSESLGVNGETDIVRRITVGNTPVNALVLDAHSTTHDCVTIHGTPEITQLWFQIVDTNGRVVDTQGLPVSFSVIFQDLNE